MEVFRDCVCQSSGATEEITSIGISQGAPAPLTGPLGAGVRECGRGPLLPVTVTYLLLVFLPKTTPGSLFSSAQRQNRKKAFECRRGSDRGGSRP